MGMASGSSGGVQSEINITPLVDIMLVLLIIFMVAQPKLQHGYESAIPRADQNIPPPPPDAPQPPSFVLRLSADRGTGELAALQLNTDTFGRTELKERVRLAMLTVGSAQDRVVFIDCADNVSYEDLMQAVDDVKAAGVKTVGFATEPIPQ